MIEAHSNREGAEGAELGNANGYLFDKNGGQVNLRVDGSVYILDRWD